MSHHLVGFLPPTEHYSAAKFVKDATHAIEQVIHHKNKIPIIVGGSGFYFQALSQGMFPNATPDLQVYRSIQKLSLKQKVHKLREVDPLALDPEQKHHIHPNDSYRIERALMIALSSKQNHTWSQLWKQKSKHQHTSAYEFKMYTHPLPTNHLQLLRQRIEHMLSAGLLEETKRSLEKYGHSHGFISSGYNIILDFIQGNLDKNQFLESFTTFHYQVAKKQKKWFAKNKHLTNISTSQFLEVAASLLI